MKRKDEASLASLRAELARLHSQEDSRESELARLRERQRELEERLAQQEQSHRETLTRIALAEEQATRLARLYVAILHLHGAREPAQVLEAIQEIISNIIGSEELAIFRVEAGGQALVLVSSLGIDAEGLRRVPLGQGPIGQAALTRELYVAPTPLRAGEGSPEAVSACVPLSLEDKLYGAIAIFGLLPQKQALEGVDHELLSLLAEHAAPALARAELYGRYAAAVAVSS